MSKQTAVQWLEDELKKLPHVNVIDVFEKAKAMEKEQIINAHLTGLIHPLEIEATKQAEQYYNETYVGTNEKP
jgi:hypothetical protein